MSDIDYVWNMLNKLFFLWPQWLDDNRYCLTFIASLSSLNRRTGFRSYFFLSTMIVSEALKLNTMRNKMLSYLKQSSRRIRSTKTWKFSISGRIHHPSDQTTGESSWGSDSKTYSQITRKIELNGIFSTLMSLIVQKFMRIM